MIEPAHFWMPERRGSFGDEALDLARDAGLEFDAEQELAVDGFLSYGPGGRWAAMEEVIVEARQNGKTARVLEPVVMFDLWLLEPDKIVWTAHLFSTTRETFDNFMRYIETSATLSRRVKKINAAHGEEAIELHSGAKLEFRARSSGGGRGKGGKRVVFDEALILPAAAIGALMPTLSARPNPKISYGSSAGKETSDHLHNLKMRGRSGGDPSLIYVEFCAPGSWAEPPCEQGKRCPHTVGTDGCALDNEEFWRRANHALGKRITYEYVRNERRSMNFREFGRERMGWHEELLQTLRPIPESKWAELVDPDSTAFDPVALAVEVNVDRSFAAIAMAGRREDGKVHVEVIKAQAGVAWVVDDVAHLVETWKPCALVIDDRSEAASLLPDLKDRGMKVRPTKDPDREVYGDELIVTTWASDMARACGQFHTSVVEKQDIRHLDQPELNESIKGAAWRQRQLGDARAWARKETITDPSALIAVTLALHGLLIYGPETVSSEIEGALMA